MLLPARREWILKVPEGNKESNFMERFFSVIVKEYRFLYFSYIPVVAVGSL